jgi:DNA-binding transcriptional LysR family regulator
MELKHLRALVGIADRGSFSGAAEILGTVQSNISAHVARLERELEVPLVDRSSGLLTDEGAVVVARARRMIGELDAMVADVVALRQEITGTVRAGMIGTTGRWLVPLVFARLRERHPSVHLNVADGTTMTLEPQLISGHLDVAIVTLPLHGDELSATPLFEEDLMLVVPVDHPLALCDQRQAGAPLPLSVLEELQLVLPMPGTQLRTEIDAAVNAAGVTLTPAMELDGLRMIASLTFDGYGPAILPATAVPVHLRDQFCMLSLQGLAPRHVGIALRSRGMPSAPTRVVIEILNEVVDDASIRPEGLRPSPR